MVMMMTNHPLLNLLDNFRTQYLCLEIALLLLVGFYDQLPFRQKVLEEKYAPLSSDDPGVE